MAPNLRKRKTIEPSPEPAKLINPTTSQKRLSESRVDYKDDDPFEAAFDVEGSRTSDDESDVSDYGRSSNSRRRSKKVPAKKRKVQHAGPGLAPEAAAMSDDDLEVDYDETNLFISNRTTYPEHASRRFVASPSNLQIQVDAKTTVLLDIRDLLRQNGLQLASASAVTAEPVHLTSPNNSRNVKRNLFMILPPELRNRVYRMVLVTDEPIVFRQRNNFKRSAQFLRSSRVIAEEGTCVMYGENSFHFERTPEKRGKYWEKSWKEIGFKDIRRFLETIGNANIAKMTHVSFELEDATPYLTPDLDATERKFVNDPVLQHLFNLVAANASLARLDVKFSGRSAVQMVDYHFLKALSGIKAPIVKFPKSSLYSGIRISDEALTKLETIMITENIMQVDESKVRRMIKMMFDEPKKANYNTFAF